MDQTVIDKIKASFARQSYMTTLGAALDHIGKGSVSIRAPYVGPYPATTRVCTCGCCLFHGG
jgi:hypothetical protein